MIKHKNEKGYTLIGVLLIFTIVSILGVSLVSLSVASVKTSTVERDHQSVYYVAEAGLNYYLKEIEKEVEKAEEVAQAEIDRLYEQNEILEVKLTSDKINEIGRDLFFDKLNSSFNKLINKNPYRKFESVHGVDEIGANLIIPPPIELEENRKRYVIESHGFMDNEERAVKKEIEIEWGESKQEEIESGSLPEYAVFVKDDVNIRGTFEVVNGKLGAESDSVSVNLPEQQQDVPAPVKVPTLPPFPEFPSKFDYGCESLPSVSSSDCDTLTVFENKTIQLNKNSEVDNLVIKNGQTLTLEISGVTDLKVNKLILEQGSMLQVKTKRKTDYLNLLVKEKPDLAFGSKLGIYPDMAYLNIYYDGNETFEYNNSLEINGSLYAKSANINVSGPTTIRGNILSGGNKVTVNGSFNNFSQLIFAPDAIVEFFGAIEYFGMLVVKSIESSKDGVQGGASKFTYVDCKDADRFDFPYYYACPEPINEGPLSIKALREWSENPGNSEGENIHQGVVSIKQIGKTKEVKIKKSK